MNTFTIDKNYPIPAAANRYEHKFPWTQMCVGDSFFLPVNSPMPEKVRTRVMANSYQHLGVGCVASRKVPGGFRFWRIK